MLKNLSVEKVAEAVEAGAGEVLPGLRESLNQAKLGHLRVVRSPNPKFADINLNEISEFIEI